MVDVLNISLKNIKDVEKLLTLRNNIRDEITELKLNDDINLYDDINLLKKQYFNISNKINYIKNSTAILEKYKEKNRAYVKDNYEIIKEKNKEYQRIRREKFKQLEEFYNNTNSHE